MTRDVAANPKHRKGAKVTNRRMQLHSTVEDTHVSYRARRGDSEIVVGHGEKVEGVDELLESHVSYLIVNPWDGVAHWVPEAELESGHVFPGGRS
jgi:hypothetical protein